MLALLGWTALLPCVLAFYPYPDLATSASHHATSKARQANSRRDPLYMLKPKENRHLPNDGSFAVKLTKLTRRVCCPTRPPSQIQN